MRWVQAGWETRRVAPRASALVLAVAFLATALPAAVWAAAGEVATTAVVKFHDKTGRGSALLEAKVTDAIALALQDSREYLVTPAREVEREMQALALQSPLSTAEAVRLGKRLDVDSVTTGDILKATVDQRTGRAAVELELRMVDVEAAELLDGAARAVETKAIPGWSGTEAEILNEAVRQCAEEVVAKMLSSRVPRGTIEAVMPRGACEINLGSQDGVSEGMKLVVMRPVYLRELETTVLRKIGRVEVSSTQPDICYADPVAAVAPRTGDLVLRVYEPQVVAKAAVARRDRSDFLWGAVGAAVLLAFAGIATGGSGSEAPPVPISYLHQNAMGDVPVIRVEFPNLVKSPGFLLFRGHSAGFPADAPYLVEVLGDESGVEVQIKFMDDNPQALAEQDRTITVHFNDESGDPTTEDVECTWTHPALTPGETYFHKVRLVTKPQFPPGTNPPLSGTGGTENVFQNPDNTITQGGDFPMISRPTREVGPVTYILSPQLKSPPENPLPQNPASITFEWEPTTGADEYCVQVFPASDPNGVGQPIFQRAGIRGQGSGTISETWLPATGDLQPNSLYYWRVGARKSTELLGRGQGMPRVGFGSTQVLGYVFSVMRSFPTPDFPPNPTGSTTQENLPAQSGAEVTKPVRPGKGGGAPVVKGGPKAAGPGEATAGPKPRGLAGRGTLGPAKAAPRGLGK